VEVGQCDLTDLNRPKATWLTIRKKIDDEIKKKRKKYLTLSLSLKLNRVVISPV
jgi:hypothetical protein